VNDIYKEFIHSKDRKMRNTTSDAAGQTAPFPLKSLFDIIKERRATMSFEPFSIPDELLETILQLSLQAPSGYNLQPWRFVVVTDQRRKDKLKEAAFGQEKVSQASAIIIALGMKESWKKTSKEVFEQGAKRGAGDPSKIDESIAGAFKFLDSQSMPVWVTRHTMIPFTYLMLICEAFGLNTAPMEGFNPESVRSAIHAPQEAEIVAMLAIGKAKGPSKPYPGRFDLSRVVFRESCEEHWKTTS